MFVCLYLRQSGTQCGSFSAIELSLSDIAICFQCFPGGHLHPVSGKKEGVGQCSWENLMFCLDLEMVYFTSTHIIFHLTQSHHQIHVICMVNVVCRKNRKWILMYNSLFSQKGHITYTNEQKQMQR